MMKQPAKCVILPADYAGSPNRFNPNSLFDLESDLELDSPCPTHSWGGYLMGQEIEMYHDRTSYEQTRDGMLWLLKVVKKVVRAFSSVVRATGS